MRTCKGAFSSIQELAATPLYIVSELYYTMYLSSLDDLVKDTDDAKTAEQKNHNSAMKHLAESAQDLF